MCFMLWYCWGVYAVSVWLFVICFDYLVLCFGFVFVRLLLGICLI